MRCREGEAPKVREVTGPTMSHLVSCGEGSFGFYSAIVGAHRDVLRSSVIRSDLSFEKNRLGSGRAVRRQLH